MRKERIDIFPEREYDRSVRGKPPGKKEREMVRMKKGIALVLVMVLVLGLAACSKTAQTPAEKVAGYVQQSGEALAKSLEELFGASSDMTCASTVKAEGTGIVIEIRIDQMDGLTQEQKELLQSTYDSMEDSFAASLEAVQKDLPEVTYLTIHVCEKDGDVAATIQIGKK